MQPRKLPHIKTRIAAGKFFTAVKTAVKASGDFLLPPGCIICDTAVGNHGACCPKCWPSLRFISKPYCPVMGSPFSIDIGENIISAEAIADPPPFERLRAVLLYNEHSRRLISGLKFRDRTDLAPHLAKWMCASGEALLKDKPIIIPVPLHPARLLSRKFNQSAELARLIAKHSKLQQKYEPTLLLRHRPTKQQVGLSQNQREKNVAGAFRVKKRDAISIQGENVLLIDDVYTTGATVKAATRCLKRAGAAKVDVLVFAKVETTDL